MRWRRQQQWQVEGFLQQRMGPGRGDPLALVGLGGDDDNRQRRLHARKTVQRIPAIHFRHVEVEQQQVEVFENTRSRTCPP